jgi:asparagine synthase (glutamine-hydrolysing)
MCGIFGLISERWNPQALQLAQEISHRGPDDSGIFRDQNLCLIHYRLSILDVSPNGHQPMISDDGRYILILNGEIYNHLDIRKQLSAIQFKSTSDTETVLYAYAASGPAIFSELNGIFALAIYDKLKNELVIARDQLGVKPLYYHQSSDGFAFSSELKSLAALPDMDRTIDLQALLNYIQFIYSPGIQTPLKSIHKILPGHYMRISVPQSRIIEIKKYYSIPFTGKYEAHEESYWIDQIDLALQKAVQRQLLSDVPVGYFISGGLDSSLIAAIAKKLNPGKRLTGFTIRISELGKRDGFVDDFPYAIQVAELLDIDLKIVDGNVNMAADLDDMIWQLDEPQAEVSSLYVASIAKMARANGIYVLLSGMGGDDLFAGYRRHQAIQYDRYMYKLPYSIRRGLASFGNLLEVNAAGIRRLKKFLTKFEKQDIAHGMADYYKWLKDDRAIKLFSDSSRKQLSGYDNSLLLLDSLQEIPDEKDPLNQMLFWDMHYFLPDHNLNYTDKMSMKHAVEVRVPYCDIDLIKLSTIIPPQLKIRNGISKYLLKKVAERYLPKNIIYRPKTGFGGPLRKWMESDMKEMIAQILSKDNLNKYGIFDFNEVNKLIEDNHSGKIDASYSILSLMAIQSWLKLFQDNH